MTQAFEVVETDDVTGYYKEETARGTVVAPAGSDAFRHTGISATIQTGQLESQEYGQSGDPQKGAVVTTGFPVTIGTELRPPMTIGDTPEIHGLLRNLHGGSVDPAGGKGAVYQLVAGASLSGSCFRKSNIGQYSIAGLILGELLISFPSGGQTGALVTCQFTGQAKDVQPFMPFTGTQNAAGTVATMASDYADLDTLGSGGTIADFVGKGTMVKFGATGAGQLVQSINPTARTATLAGASLAGTDGDSVDVMDGLPSAAFENTLAPVASDGGYLEFGGEVFDIDGGTIRYTTGRRIDYTSWGQLAANAPFQGTQRCQVDLTVKATRAGLMAINSARRDRSYVAKLYLGDVTGAAYYGVDLGQLTLSAGTINRARNAPSTIPFSGLATVSPAMAASDTRCFVFQVLTGVPASFTS